MTDIVFAVEDAATPDARSCIDAYFDVLAERFEEGFDRRLTREVDVASMTPPRGFLVIGRLEGAPVACGALKLLPDTPNTGEIKHVWVAQAARGRRAGHGVMGFIESLALKQGLSAVRLDTNRVLTAAIAMYRSRGYEEVPAFNEETYAHHWFVKQLTSGQVS